MKTWPRKSVTLECWNKNRQENDTLKIQLQETAKWFWSTDAGLTVISSAFFRSLGVTDLGFFCRFVSEPGAFCTPSDSSNARRPASSALQYLFNVTLNNSCDLEVRFSTCERVKYKELTIYIYKNFLLLQMQPLPASWCLKDKETCDKYCKVVG